MCVAVINLSDGGGLFCLWIFPEAGARGCLMCRRPGRAERDPPVAIWEYGGSFQLHKVQLLDLACFPVWIGLRALRPVYVLPVQGEGSNL